MRNYPTKKQLAAIPGLNETKGIPRKDKIVYLHFWMGYARTCDWYVVEFDGDDTFYGYMVLLSNKGEWRKFRLSRLDDLRISIVNQVDLDTKWKPKKASEISRITKL